MPKQIKLSDVVAAELEKRAAEDNLSLVGEVAKLLATSQLPPSPVDTSYFDKKFEELLSAINNTAVDRLDGGGRAPGYSTSSYNGKAYIEWPVMQDLFYDFLQEGDKEWFAGQCRAIKELSDELNCYLKDGVIYTDDYYGHPISILKATPRVIDFLKEKGCDLS